MIYLATSFSNPHIDHVRGVLTRAGHDVFDFRPITPSFNAFARAHGRPREWTWRPGQFVEDVRTSEAASKCFEADLHAMQESDLCVLLTPCGASAHLEAGYMVGLGKPLVVVLEPGCSFELLYRMADRIVWHERDLVDAIALVQDPARVTPA